MDENIYLKMILDKWTNSISKDYLKYDFFLKLLNELQKVGTIPAININEYGNFLTKF